MNPAISPMLDHLRRHGIIIRPLGRFNLPNTSEYSVSFLLHVGDCNLGNGCLSYVENWDHFLLCPGPDQGSHKVSFGDPTTFYQLDRFIHRMKNSCPQCGVAGPPVICQDCRDQARAEYEADLRQSRGY